jgi:hypothetical protein
MIISVWKSYARNVFGTTCPVFGQFTNDGQIIPSQELAEIADLKLK